MPGSRTRARGVTYDDVCRLALALPGVEEGTSYGTPALKVAGKLMARLREDGETLALACDFEERERLMAADPEVFHLTDHYLNYPWVLARLPKIRPAQLAAALEHARQRAAAKPRARQRPAAHAPRRGR